MRSCRAIMTRDWRSSTMGKSLPNQKKILRVFATIRIKETKLLKASAFLVRLML
jgi:hypothetical protein